MPVSPSTPPSRGLRTALVERHDFASGTSSKSSKMVHGGLRYLQQRDFRLVYEALHERQRLLENAPHLVAPAAVPHPAVRADGVGQQERGADLRHGAHPLRPHRWAAHRQAPPARSPGPRRSRHLPTLRTDRLVAGFLYYDARADDARLTLAIARTAALDHGAVLANYTEVVSLVSDTSGVVMGARVRPAVPDTRRRAATAGATLDGAKARIGGAGTPDEFEVRAHVVVNATGVWADDVRALDEPSHPHSIRPAKGIHVTVPRSKLPADIAAVIPVPKDRRSIFVVPWPDGDDVYLGTTDTDWDGPLDDPACLPGDVDYVLDAANGVVTEPLGRQDVTGVWAGLRPLLAPPEGRHVSDRTADLSRRHTVRVSDHGLITVTGGKLTTYRRMAEDTVDAVVKRLGPRLPSGARRCRTRRLALLGSSGLEQLRGAAAAARLGVDEDVLVALVGRHGGETPAVLELASGRPELLEPLVPGLPHLRVEALWAVRHEMAMTVDDVLSRRTRAVLRRAAGRRGRGSRRRRAPGAGMGSRRGRHRPGTRPPSRSRLAGTSPVPGSRPCRTR